MSANAPTTASILVQVLGVAAQVLMPRGGAAVAGGIALYNAFREALLNKFQVSPEERESLLEYLGIDDGATTEPPKPADPPPVTTPTPEYSKLYGAPQPTPGDAGVLIANGYKGGDIVFGLTDGSGRWYVNAPEHAPRGNSEVLFTI